MTVDDRPLTEEREQEILAIADQGYIPTSQALELLWEIERLRRGQNRLLELMKAGQTWDDRWLSSEALLTQREIRDCFGWKAEPPAGARPSCTCKHTLKRHPDGGPCEYCKGLGATQACTSYTPEED